MKPQKHHFGKAAALTLSLFMLTTSIPANAVELYSPDSSSIVVNAYSSVDTGVYYLKNNATGTYLSVDGSKAANAQNLSVAAKKETSAFQFGISGSASAGYYLSSQINSAYVINPYSDTPKNGTNMTLYQKNTDGTQLFYFEETDGGYYLRSKYNTKLAVTVSGTNVQLSTYSGGDSQLWTLEKVSTGYETIAAGKYYLTNAKTGKALCVDGAKAANGQNLSVADVKKTNAFRFNISGNASDGYFLASLLNTGFVVNPYSDTPKDGTNATLYKKTLDGTQNWYFEKYLNGYLIRNNYNKSLVLTVDDNNNVKVAAYAGGTDQVWTLSQVEAEEEPESDGYVAQTEGYYRLKNSSTGTYLNFAKAANGQAAALGAYQDSNAYKFHLTGSADNGYLLCSALNESYVVNPYSDTPGNGTKITLYKKSGDGTQNWFFKKNSSGYTLHNRYAEDCVITAGSTVTISTNASSAAQTWILESVDVSTDEPTEPAETEVESYTAPFTWNKDNWSFANTDQNFQYGYFIEPLLLNRLVKENKLSNKDRDQMVGWMSEEWGGSCYGLTVTELLVLDKYMDLSDYGGNTSIVSNTATINMTSLINFYQFSQSFDLNNQKFREDSFAVSNYYDQRKVLQTVYNHFKKGGKAFNLCYKLAHKWPTGEMTYEWGHSVVCYGVTSCEDQNGGKGYQYPGNGKYYTHKLLIADPNYLDEGQLYDEACVYFNLKDGSWVVPYLDDVLFRDKLGLAHTQYCHWDANTKMKYGLIDELYTYNGIKTVSLFNEEDEATAVDHYLAGIKFRSTSSSEYKIDRVVQSGNGLYNAGDGVDIARVSHFGDGTEQNKNTTEEYALWNPTASYTLSYETPQSFDVYMDYEFIAYDAKAENATATVFDPDGSIIVRGEDVTYDIKLITEDDKSVTDWYAMTVSGGNTSAVTFTLAENGYILAADSLQNINASAKNDEVTPSVSFSTDATAVLIYEIDANTIGVAVDSDGDGSYETTIAQSEAAPEETTEPTDPTEPTEPADPTDPSEPVVSSGQGDINGDGEINAVDAADLLSAAAQIGAGEDSGLTDAQKTAADVDGNGEINAVDASIILQYAAALGAGDTNAKIEDFV